MFFCLLGFRVKTCRPHGTNHTLMQHQVQVWPVKDLINSSIENKPCVSNISGGYSLFYIIMLSIKTNKTGNIKVVKGVSKFPIQ